MASCHAVGFWRMGEVDQRFDRSDGRADGLADMVGADHTLNGETAHRAVDELGDTLLAAADMPTGNQDTIHPPLHAYDALFDALTQAISSSSTTSCLLMAFGLILLLLLRHPAPSHTCATWDRLGLITTITTTTTPSPPPRLIRLLTQERL